MAPVIFLISEVLAATAEAISYVEVLGMASDAALASEGLALGRFAPGFIKRSQSLSRSWRLAIAGARRVDSLTASAEWHRFYYVVNTLDGAVKDYQARLADAAVYREASLTAKAESAATGKAAKKMPGFDIVTSPTAKHSVDYRPVVELDERSQLLREVVFEDIAGEYALKKITDPLFKGALARVDAAVAARSWLVRKAATLAAKHIKSATVKGLDEMATSTVRDFLSGPDVAIGGVAIQGDLNTQEWSNLMTKPYSNDACFIFLAYASGYWTAPKGTGPAYSPVARLNKADKAAIMHHVAVHGGQVMAERLVRIAASQRGSQDVGIATMLPNP